MHKFGIVLCITLLVTGCASSKKSREAANKYKKYLKTEKYEDALKVVESKDFYNDENSKLLKQLEIASAHYYAKNYYQALKYFDNAKELSGLLFTKSISKKGKTFIYNDNSDNYYGELYERSFIRFYQALTHYQLFLSGKYEEYSTVDLKKKEIVVPEKVLSNREKLNHLRASRSVLIEWDSLLSEFSNLGLGDVVYKDDLTAKLFGAHIHEVSGSTEDRQIALALYRKARTILLKGYSIYPTYNHKSEKFKKNYSKFPMMALTQVKRDYVDYTQDSKALIKYIDENIKRLKKRRKNNVTVLLQDGFIAPKVADKVNIPLNIMVLPAGIADKTDFTSFVLKMLYVSSAGKPMISFELPKIAYNFDSKKYKIILKKNKKVVKTTEAVHINPLSDIAKVAIDNKSLSTKFKIGARVTTKQVAALGAAYLTYSSTREKIGEEFAILAGTASYHAANEGIKSSEEADLRQWVSLPSHVAISSFNVPVGSYDLYIEQIDSKGKPYEKSMGKFEVKSGSNFITHRIF